MKTKIMFMVLLCKLEPSDVEFSKPAAKPCWALVGLHRPMYPRSARI